MDGWKDVIDTVRASLGLGGIRFSYEWLKEMTHLHLDQSERSVCVWRQRESVWKSALAKTRGMWQQKPLHSPKKKQENDTVTHMGKHSI